MWCEISDKMDTSGPVTYGGEPCWNWTGKVTRNGYASTTGTSTVYLIVWRLSGRVRPPKGRQIHHACKNGLCCNPSHLVEVDQQLHRRLHDKFSEEMRHRRLAELREAIESEERVCA
jgi:hypothetical protein